MSYKVKLPTFEGPFDLLVYLIENAQMSIYDIQVSEITGQYLAYIKAMQEMDFTVGTEFMVLAATLIDIKSKMILPRTTVDGTTVLEEDPRSELVERLLEYKRFKKAAEILAEQEEYMSFVYEKPQEDISAYLEEPDIAKLNFKDLIPDKKDRYDVVVTFTSVLQMMRDKYLDAEQKHIYGEIMIVPGERAMEETIEHEQ